MTFNKYKEYVLAKENSREITVSISNYRNYIASELSSLVLRKTNLYDEAKDFLINHQKIEEKLNRNNCPFVENIKISMKSNNLDSMKNCLMKHKESIDANTFVYLESCVFNYEAKILGQMFAAKDVDDCVESLVDECNSNIEKLKGIIFKGLLHSKIEHIPVSLEVCLPKKLKAESVVAKIDYVIPILLKFNLNDFQAESLTTELPSKAQKIQDDLIEFYNNKKKISKFVTGFLGDGPSKKAIYENKQKELALGMKTYLNKDVVIFKEPPKGNLDVWEVKIQNPSLFETVESYKLTEDAQIRWINLIRRYRNEK